MDGLYEKQKTTAGTFATLLWIAFGAYLFAITDRASFFSWQAAVYFVAGMFLAAIVFGTAAYAIQGGIAKILVRLVSEPSAGAASLIQGIGIILMIVEAVVIYFVARWVVTTLLFPA